MKLIDKFKKIKETMGNPFSGGATPFKDISFFQHIKPNTPTLWYNEKQGDKEIIIMYLEKKIVKKE